MVQRIMMLGAAVLILAAVPAAQAGCPGCDKIAKTGHGFCCGKGKVFGVSLTSKKLFKSLEGQEIDPSKIHCPGCKKAYKTNGKCEHCNVEVANGKLYHSWVSHSLAVGKQVDAKKAAYCGGCKKAYEENGRCDHCSVGFVAGRMFKDTDMYKHAVAALTTLSKAAEAAGHCESCAIAMVTNGTCEKCNVSFKDGNKETG
ncbi:MAG: hypothetical protein PVI86_08585 [Phycisphaerae bacterium]|jgi:hypothetical protein